MRIGLNYIAALCRRERPPWRSLSRQGPWPCPRRLCRRGSPAHQRTAPITGVMVVVTMAHTALTTRLHRVSTSRVRPLLAC
jgi:hypothetical protein